VALIGCGAIAESMHLPVLAGHEGLRLEALVDRNLERARKLAHGYAVARVVADAAELRPDEVDAAIVATPPFHHAPCACDLMQRGVHVLVEKPMATNYADAVRMVETSERRGVALAVGFFRRLNPSIRLTKSLLDSGWLGRPLRFVAEGGGMYNWAAATLSSMRKDWAGGGVLIDFGSHVLDLLFALFREPALVLEYRDNALGGVEADCSLRLRLTHDTGPVEGTVELARTRMLGDLIRIECERGTIEFHIGERFRVKVVPHDLELVDPLHAGRRAAALQAAWEGEDETASWYETFRKQIDDWVEAIQTGREPRLSGRSSLPALGVIEACYAHRQPLPEPWVHTWPDRRTERVNGEPDARHRQARRRVLVTGATGFIGSRVAEILHLRDGWDVRALVHNPGNASRLARLPVEMVQGDLKSPEEARRLVEGCDAVVHCAIGTAWGQRREIFSVTVDGTRHLAEAALHAGVRRLVHLSTMSVYGDDSQLTGLLDEATPVHPVKGSDYGESKAAAERMIQQTVQKGLSAAILRPARVYGPFSRIFIMRPLEALAKGGFRWLGNPDVPCDMVFVDNLVEVICRCLDAPAAAVRGEVFNVGDGQQTTWREFYQFFADRLGLDLAKTPIDAPQAPAGARNGLLGLPGRWVRGVKAVIGSREFRGLGRRVLETDPIGTLPRWALERFPVLERTARRVVRADDSLPVYRRGDSTPDLVVQMGSGGAVLRIDKLRRQLQYEPAVSPERALGWTLDWVKHARIVG
jgi:predicted dehydrogenase/nucleoside-diphosphate-sugar epimerase